MILFSKSLVRGLSAFGLVMIVSAFSVACGSDATDALGGSTDGLKGGVPASGKTKTKGNAGKHDEAGSAAIPTDEAGAAAPVAGAAAPGETHGKGQGKGKGKSQDKATKQTGKGKAGAAGAGADDAADEQDADDDADENGN